MNDWDASTNSSLEIETVNVATERNGVNEVESEYLYWKIEKRSERRNVPWKQKCRYYENKSASSSYNQLSSINYAAQFDQNLNKMITGCQPKEHVPDSISWKVMSHTIMITLSSYDVRIISLTEQTDWQQAMPATRAKTQR